MDCEGAKADDLTPNYCSPALQITNNLCADSVVDLQRDIH